MTKYYFSRRTALKSASVAALATSVGVGLTPRSVRAQNQSDVLIIGAGLAGLSAAHVLQDQGYSVQVIEGRERIGGRILSLSDIPGNPEAGGNGIGAGYGRVIDAAERFGAKLNNILDRTPFILQRNLFLEGKMISPQEWPDHPRNVFAGPFKQMMPWVFTPLFIIQNMPLESYEDWYDPKTAPLDISIHDWFLSKGVTEEQINLAFNINSDFGNSSYDVSALMLMFVYAWGTMQRSIQPRATYAAQGGNQRIPEAMAAALKNEVHLGRKVIGINSDSTGAEAHCADGIVYRAKRVISSIPFSVLRTMKIEPGLSGVQSRAVQTLGKQLLTQSHLVAKEPFWEEDGMPVGMFSDSILGNVMAQHFGEEPKEVTSITCWHRGWKAQQVDQLPEEDAKRMIIKAFEEQRPASKGKLEVAGFKSWYNDPFSSGDWAVWEPGQIKDFIIKMAEPHGNLHFCGEHTALSNRGMEGAMESGERVAFEVMDVI
jgi:monoamine oxidase